MIRLPRTMRKGIPVFALAIVIGVVPVRPSDPYDHRQPGARHHMAVGAVPVRPSDLAEQPLSPQERKVLDEYRLRCRPGRFIEDVRANLYSMQKRYPGSTFLKDSAFLAEVHYLDEGFLWDGNGRKPPGWVHYEMFDTIFNGYAPSREAWSRSRMHGGISAGFAFLGALVLAANAFFGLHALVNEPPRRERSLVIYRFAQIALPIGWISSYVYSGICAARKNREFDKAFFESNGKAIAKRLAEDL